VNGFKGVELRIANFVLDEVEDHLLVIALDGEDLLKDSLKANDLPLFRFETALEELIIGLELDLNEVRWLDWLVDLAKVSALGHRRGGLRVGNGS
jgi:hypothetical protein